MQEETLNKARTKLQQQTPVDVYLFHDSTVSDDRAQTATKNNSRWVRWFSFTKDPRTVWPLLNTTFPVNRAQGAQPLHNKDQTDTF